MKQSIPEVILGIPFRKARGECQWWKFREGAKLDGKMTKKGDGRNLGGLPVPS